MCIINARKNCYMWYIHHYIHVKLMHYKLCKRFFAHLYVFLDGPSDGGRCGKICHSRGSPSCLNLHFAPGAEKWGAGLHSQVLPSLPRHLRNREPERDIIHRLFCFTSNQPHGREVFPVLFLLLFSILSAFATQIC